jgi:hypothetical protein
MQCKNLQLQANAIKMQICKIYNIKVIFHQKQFKKNNFIIKAKAKGKHDNAALLTLMANLTSKGYKTPMFGIMKDYIVISDKNNVYQVGDHYHLRVKLEEWESTEKNTKGYNLSIVA